MVNQRHNQNITWLRSFIVSILHFFNILSKDYNSKSFGRDSDYHHVTIVNLLVEPGL